MAELTREELNALRCKAPDLEDESQHFYVCADCGQAVDKRQLGDVFHHMDPGHERIPEQ